MRALSVDEGGMSRLRRVRTILDQEMDRSRQSSDTTDYLTTAPTEPAQPPYPPPQETTTPVEGVHYGKRTWPVRVCHRVRRRVSKVFGRRLEPHRESMGLRWRPPVGHTPRRFEAPDAHPFHQALTTPLSSRSSQFLHNDITVPPISPWREQSLRQRSTSSGRSASAAQRALGAITGQIIPVNPARALSPGIARSVSVPKRVGPAKLVTVSRDRLRRKTSDSSAFGTTRTIDMIGQFPLPPIRLKSGNGQPLNNAVPAILAPSPLRPKRTSLDVLKLQKAGSEMANATEEDVCSQLDGALELNQQNNSSGGRRASGDRRGSCTERALAFAATPNYPNTVTIPVEDTAVGFQFDGSSISTPTNSRYHSAEPLVTRQPIMNDPMTKVTFGDVRVDNTHTNDGELYMSGALPSPPVTPDLHPQSIDSEPSYIIDKPQAKIKLTAKTDLVHPHSSLLDAFHLGPHEEPIQRTQAQPVPPDQSRHTDAVPSQAILPGILLPEPHETAS